VETLLIYAALVAAVLVLVILVQVQIIIRLKEELGDVREERRYYMIAIRDALTVNDVRGFLRHRIGMKMLEATKDNV
jgi:hypothetical protein